ncbi:MAG: sigma-E processing peptidase SpoIIGA [Agathobacter sp.]|nr:sigma-E processing peptidase SpoIIGA [Agathobacter sp.]
MGTGDYVFYGDIYLLQSVFLKITVIYLSLLTKRYVRRIALWIVGLLSVLGTFIEILLLLLIPGSFGLVRFLWVIEYPLFFLILIGRKDKRKQVISLSMWSVVYVILLNGLIQAMDVRWEGNYTVMFLFGMACVCYVSRRILMGRGVKKGIYPFCMQTEHGSIVGEALYDSGNQLRDPYTGKGVSVGGYIIKEQLALKSPVYVPYSSVGNPSGILEVYYVEKLVIYKEKEEVILHKVPIAITQNMPQGQKYQLILNQDVW